MTLYEFFCPSCKTPYEKRLSLENRNQETQCPHCGSIGSHRVLSAPAIHYNAPGFTKNTTPNIPSNSGQAERLWKSASHDN